MTGVASSNRVNKKPNGKVYKYTRTIYQYRCNKAKMSKLCPFTKYLNEEKMEQSLLDNLNRFVNDHVTFVKITANTNTHTDGVKNSIANIQAEMHRLNTMYRKGRVKEDEYDRDYEAMEKQMAELQESLAPVEERDLTVYEELLGQNDWQVLYDALDRENKRAFWRKYIKAIKLDNEGKIDEIIFF